MDHTRAVVAPIRPHRDRNNRCGRSNGFAAAGRGRFPGPTIPALFCGSHGIGEHIRAHSSGFIAVAETSIISLLYHEPLYSLKLTRTIDLLGIEIYAVIAALSVESFCRAVDRALAENSAALSACKEAESRLADCEVQLGLTRNSEAWFRATFDNAAVGIAHNAPDGRWLRVNGALSRILGYPVDELLAKSLQDVTYSDDLETDLVQVELLRDGKIDSYHIDTCARTARSSGQRRLLAAYARTTVQSTIL